MKNTQKKFLSAILAASSVAGVVAPAVTAFAAETSVAQVETLVANALKDKTFYSFNVAYGAILGLPTAEQGKYLEKIAPLEAVVRTAKIDTILRQIDKFYETQEMSIYNNVLYTLIPEVPAAVDREYLQYELGKWGTEFIVKQQPEYIAATNAIIAVDNALQAGKLADAQALVPAAKTAIANVKHAKNLEYLNTVTLPEVQTRLDAAVNAQAVKVSVVEAVSDTTVALPSTEVAADSKYKITFSAKVDKTTVTTGTVYVVDKNGVKQLVSVAYDEDKATATVEVSAGVLAAGSEYKLTVDGVKDTKGTAVAKTVQSFTVSNSPIVVSAKYSTTANDATGTLANLSGASVDGAQEAIKIVFNKDMDKNTVNTSSVKIYDLDDNKYIASVVTYVDAKTYTVAPEVALTATHKYKLVVNTSAADLAGNKVVANKEVSYFYNAAAFTIGSLSPANSDTGVYPKLTAYAGHEAFKFKGKFSAAVDASTVNNTTVVFTEKETGVVVDATVAYEAGSQYVIVTPKADLKENTVYQVVVDGVKNEKGLKVTKSTTAFTTGDFTVPTVVSTTPAMASDNVAVDSDIVINFSEKMDATKLILGTDIVLKNVTDDATKDISGWQSILSEDGKTLTIKVPAADKLLPNKTYELTAKKTIEDASAQNNTLAADVKIQFNTSASSTTALVDVRKTDFDSDGTVVANNVYDFDESKLDIFFNFNQAISSTDLTGIKVEKLNANGVYETAAGVFTNTKVNSDKTIKVTKDAAWAKDTTFKITIPADVKDIYGNTITKVEYVFTTGDKPTVDKNNVINKNFAVNVAVDNAYLPVIIEDADSDLTRSTLNADNVKIVNKADGVAAPYTLTYTRSAKVATAVNLTAGAGKTLTATAAEYDKLTVGDIVRFGGDAFVVVEKAVTAGPTYTITLDRNHSLVGAQVATIHQGVVFKLNDNAKLASNTEYQVSVTGVKDAAGNTVSSTTYTFRTATPDTNFNYASATIADGQTGVAVNQTLEFTYNDNVLNATGVTVTEVGTGNVTAKFDISVDGAKIKVVPKGFLKADTVYTIALPNTIAQKTDAADTADAKTFNFRTEQTASVKPQITSAEYYELGATGIAGDVIKITFNAAFDTTAQTFAASDLAFAGLGSEDLGAAVIAPSADNKSIVITLAADSAFVPGVSTVKLVNSDTDNDGVYDVVDLDQFWLDGVGNKFVTDTVTIVKK